MRETLSGAKQVLTEGSPSTRRGGKQSLATAKEMMSSPALRRASSPPLRREREREAQVGRTRTGSSMERTKREEPKEGGALNKPGMNEDALFSSIQRLLATHGAELTVASSEKNAKRGLSSTLQREEGAVSPVDMTITPREGIIEAEGGAEGGADARGEVAELRAELAAMREEHARTLQQVQAVSQNVNHVHQQGARQTQHTSSTTVSTHAQGRNQHRSSSSPPSPPRPPQHHCE
eukprot:1200854-Rhodomonas_salina.1